MLVLKWNDWTKDMFDLDRQAVPFCSLAVSGFACCDSGDHSGIMHGSALPALVLGWLD